LPWNDVFRTVMTRMEPAAKQGCVLHPSVRASRYQFCTSNLPILSSKNASTRCAKQRGHKVFQTILCSKETPTQSIVRSGTLSRFRWVPRSQKCSRFRGWKPTRPLATWREAILDVSLQRPYFYVYCQVVVVDCLLLARVAHMKLPCLKSLYLSRGKV